MLVLLVLWVGEKVNDSWWSGTITASCTELEFCQVWNMLSPGQGLGGACHQGARALRLLHWLGLVSSWWVNRMVDLKRGAYIASYYWPCIAVRGSDSVSRDLSQAGGLTGWSTLKGGWEGYIVSCYWPCITMWRFMLGGSWKAGITAFVQRWALLLHGRGWRSGAWETEATCLLQMTLIKPSVKEKEAAGAGAHGLADNAAAVGAIDSVKDCLSERGNSRRLPAQFRIPMYLNFGSIQSLETEELSDSPAALEVEESRQHFQPIKLSFG
ncbi:hypothetical protein MHYP_G00206530 [Metynnis hypsauchen]